MVDNWKRKIEIAEVINQMVRRACLFENPKMMPTKTTTTTTTRSTTVYRNRNRVKTEAKASDEVAIEKEVDPVLVHPVVAEAAYPNLVSIHKTTNKLAKLHIIKF